MVEGLGPRLEMVPLDEDPFAARQTVRFEDDAGEFIAEGLDALKGREVSEARISGDAVFFEEVSCEGFRCFQAGQDPGRSHGRDSRRREFIHDAVAQGILGSDDGELDPRLFGEGDDRFRFIVAADSDLCRKGGDAGVVGFHVGKEAGIPARAHEIASAIACSRAPLPMRRTWVIGVSFRC